MKYSYILHWLFHYRTVFFNSSLYNINSVTIYYKVPLVELLKDKHMVELFFLDNTSWHDM